MGAWDASRWANVLVSKGAAFIPAVRKLLCCPFMAFKGLCIPCLWSPSSIFKAKNLNWDPFMLYPLSAVPPPSCSFSAFPLSSKNSHDYSNRPFVHYKTVTSTESLLTYKVTCPQVLGCRQTFILFVKISLGLCKKLCSQAWDGRKLRQ